MKKILQSTALLLLTGSLFAQTQVPNPDFENWTLFKPAYNFYAPDSWSDGSACASATGGTESCEFFIQRTTDAQSGTYALAHFDVNPVGTTDINYSSFGNFGEGFSTPAFTGRPTSVSFYYKYATDDNQPMSITFLLYTGDLLGSYTPIGQAEYDFSTIQSTYKKVDVNFTYLSVSSPTNILITSDYGGDSPATALDTLKWDNIAFNYATTTGVTDASSPDYFTVAVTNNVLTTSKDINQATLTDLAGRKVATFNQEASVFHLEQLKTGLYILTGDVNGTPFSRKIVIE